MTRVSFMSVSKEKQAQKKKENLNDLPKLFTLRNKSALEFYFHMLGVIYLLLLMFFKFRVCCNGRNKKIFCGGIQNSICHADLVFFVARSYFCSGFLLF